MTDKPKVTSSEPSIPSEPDNNRPSDVANTQNPASEPVQETAHVPVEGENSSAKAPSPLPQKPAFIPFRLEFDEAKGLLFGVVLDKPPESEYSLAEVTRAMSRVTQPTIDAEIRKQGFDHLFFPTNSVNSFFRNFKKHLAGRYQIAERRDASIRISTSADLMSAKAQTTACYGGSLLSEDKILQAISKAKLEPSLIDEKAKGKLLESDKALDILIAEGKPAINGEDGKIAFLVEEKESIQHDAESLDAIDLHEVFDYTTVDEGEELVKRIPATEGTAGLNVLGKEVKPQKGKEAKLPQKGDGVAQHPEDADILIAAMKGHPLLTTGQVRVDPVLNLKNVDLSTGNIDFHGTVNVSGNVRSGFEIKAGGDIFIKGYVNKGHLTAGGGIYISGGVQGNIDDPEHSSKFIAQGNIEAKFINQSHIQCFGELIVKEYVLNCEIVALKKVTVGLQGKKRGDIIGGTTKSNGPICIKNLGSEAYIATQVEIGTCSEAQKQLETTRLKLGRREREKYQLQTILEKFRATDTPSELGQVRLDKQRKIEATILQVEKMISEYKSLISELSEVVPDSELLYIDIERTAYPNSKISINEVSRTLKEEKNAIRIIKQKKHLEATTIPTQDKKRGK